MHELPPMSECESNGISGNCGPDCPANGCDECTLAEEMEEDDNS
jgi:hypothetical protein